MADEQTTAMDQAAAGNSVQEPDLTGKTIGDFQLLRRLGKGGMGQVYLAEQISLKRKVAVKMLRNDLAANETALKRFKAEAETVARATHANIVQVYAIGEQDSLHYMALEYVEGRTLRDLLEKKGPPDVLRSISILQQVAAALQRASELGIIHRDIKPENILITRKEEVKVTDFGLSRIFVDDQQPLNLTQSGVTMGTPLYMSPEQVEGKPLDPRTDIYSLGVTAYHLLAGQPPYKGQTAFEVAVQHVQKEPTPLQELRPDLPPELCAIVQKMMAKKPEARYQTALEVARDLAQLRDVLVGISSTMPQVSSGPGGQVANVSYAAGSSTFATTQAMPPAKRSSRRWLFIAALVLMMLGGMGLGWWINGGDLLATAPADLESNGKSEDEISLLDEKEKTLLVRFKEFADPQGVHEVGKSMDACLELGLFYLKHRDHKKYFEKGEQFFNDLAGNDGNQSLRQFGKLGQAIVLAFKGEAKASNDQFLDVLPQFKKRPFVAKMPGKFYWLSYPPVREMVARALHHNLVNMTEGKVDALEFPDPYTRLNWFLRPPPAITRDK